MTTDNNNEQLPGGVAEELKTVDYSAVGEAIVAGIEGTNDALRQATDFTDMQLDAGEEELILPDEPLQDVLFNANLSEEPVGLPPRGDCKSVQMDQEVFSPIEDNLPDKDIQIAIPADTKERTYQSVALMPNVDVASTPGGTEWMETFEASKLAAPFSSWLEETLEQEGRQFRQAVPSEKGPLKVAIPKFGDSAEKVAGEKAVLRIRAMCGMGSVLQIPLWHSGFWITLKAPSDSTLLELYRRITEEKIALGRATYGLAFANTSVFYAGLVLDFALMHVYDTTLKPELAGDIRKHINALDLPIIAWGLAAVIWPRGFPYARAVLDSKGEQLKVIKEKINVGKIQWTDIASLTPWQVAHMAKRFGSTMTKESIEHYRSQFTRGQGRTVDLAENVKVTLRSPSVDQYLNSGQKWVNNIVMMVDKAFGGGGTDKLRDAYIMDHGKATNMRQYGHYVEAIDVNGLRVEDEETIEMTLDTFSSNDEYRKNFFAGIRSFVEDATVSIIAVPATEETDKPDLPRFPHLLPIDALSVFFILLVQKATKIQARP